MSTPHIEASKEEIADIVIMPGDPMRAKYIAETYLDDIRLINSVRGMYGYTGAYKNKRITIMGSGMGCPSMGIYSYELFKFYDVQEIIRIGSCGSFTNELQLFDLFLVQNAYSDSNYAKIQNNSMEVNLPASRRLNQRIRETASKKGIKLVEGIVYTTDVFYKESIDYACLNHTYGCIAEEMEALALFHNAKLFNRKASCLLTVSDQLITKEQATIEQREKHFDQMILLALESCI